MSEGDGCGRQADDDAQLPAGDRELRAQQREVGLEHAHERGTRLVDGLTDSGCAVLARACATGAASGRSGAGHTRIAGVRAGVVQGIRFERQGGPRFRVAAGSDCSPADAARGYLSGQRPRGRVSGTGRRSAVTRLRHGIRRPDHSGRASRLCAGLGSRVRERARSPCRPCRHREGRPGPQPAPACR